jgi:hypothetical protein
MLDYSVALFKFTLRTTNYDGGTFVNLHGLHSLNLNYIIIYK